MDVDYILKVCTDDSCVLYIKSLDKYMTMSAAEAKVLISYLGENLIEFRGDKRAIYERDNLPEETAEALINRFKSLLAAKPHSDCFRKRIFCLPITIPQSYKNNKRAYKKLGVIIGIIDESVPFLYVPSTLAFMKIDKRLQLFVEGYQYGFSTDEIIYQLDLQFGVPSELGEKYIDACIQQLASVGVIIQKEQLL